VRRPFQLDGRKRIQESLGRRLEKAFTVFRTFKNFDLSFKAVARSTSRNASAATLCYVACKTRRTSALTWLQRTAAIGPPGSYDVRSNGKDSRRFTRARASSFAKRTASVAACASTFARWDSCISMVEEPSGRPSVTWDQIPQKQPEVTEDWEKMKEYREKMGHPHSLSAGEWFDGIA